MRRGPGIQGIQKAKIQQVELGLFCFNSKDSFKAKGSEIQTVELSKVYAVKKSLF